MSRREILIQSTAPNFGYSLHITFFWEKDYLNISFQHDRVLLYSRLMSYSLLVQSHNAGRRGNDFFLLDQVL